MKNYKVQFEIKFRGNTIKKFSTTVPADDQSEAFDKAKNYIDSKTESNIIDIKEVEGIQPTKNGLEEKLEKFKMLMDDDRDFGDMTSEEIDLLVDASKYIHDFFKFVKRFK